MGGLSNFFKSNLSCYNTFKFFFYITFKVYNILIISIFLTLPTRPLSKFLQKISLFFPSNLIPPKLSPPNSQTKSKQMEYEEAWTNFNAPNGL